MLTDELAPQTPNRNIINPYIHDTRQRSFIKRGLEESEETLPRKNPISLSLQDEWNERLYNRQYDVSFFQVELTETENCLTMSKVNTSQLIAIAVVSWFNENYLNS